MDVEWDLYTNLWRLDVGTVVELWMGKDDKPYFGFHQEVRNEPTQDEDFTTCQNMT